MARRPRTWFRNEIGGIPMWGLLLALVFVVGAGVFAATSIATSQTREMTWSRYTAPPDEPDPLVVLFIGDSYSAGAGASEQSLRWSTLASRALGLQEVNEALGGTGYVATSDERGCGREYCPPYGEVIAAKATDVDPDVVVISGGRNDGAPDPGYEDLVVSTIQLAQQQWPGAVVVVTSPLWDDDPVPPGFAETIAAVQAAASTAGAVYLDLGQPLSGNPDYIGEDGVHPNDAGHSAIAQAFEAAWDAYVVPILPTS